MTDDSLEAIFAQPLSLARQVRAQKLRQRGPKIYRLHAPEVECIAKDKPHRPYEFGVKVLIATPLQRCRGGEFDVHVAALPGNRYDGHRLVKEIPAISQQIGVSLRGACMDAGYRGLNASKLAGLRVYTAGQKHGVTDAIERALRRRSAGDR